MRALDGVSLSIGRGETLGVMGGSGSGKTTLAETVSLHRTPDRGRILLGGQDLSKVKGEERRKWQRRLPIIRQDARQSLEMDRTVGKQFQDLMRQYGLPDAPARIARALEQVELPSAYVDRAPAAMSGGEQQRVAIARALSLNPLLVAADEPVSGVDPHLQLDLLRLMERVQKQANVAYLLVSSEARVISRLAHRVVILYAGRVCEMGPTERILSEARHPYTRLLLGLDPGEMPPEAELAGRTIAGCPWEPNCPQATERCRQAAPPLREVSPGHWVACHEC